MPQPNRKGIVAVNLTKDMGKTHKTCALIGACAGLAAAVCLRLTVGSPLPILRLLGADTLLPPLWLVGILWLLSYALAGASVGYILACRPGGGDCDALRWRGITFLILAVTFSFAWYSLLFSSFLLLPSWICLLLAAASALLCTLSWRSVNLLPTVAAGGLALWHLLLVLTQLMVILHN